MTSPFMVKATLVPESPFRVMLKKDLSSYEIKIDPSLNEKISTCAQKILGPLKNEGWTELQVNLSSLVVIGKDGKGNIRAISIPKEKMAGVEALREEVLARSKQLSKETVNVIRERFFSQGKGWRTVSRCRLPKLTSFPSLASREEKRLNEEIEDWVRNLQKKKKEIETKSKAEVDLGKKRELTNKERMIADLIDAIKKADRKAIRLALLFNRPNPDELANDTHSKLKRGSFFGGKGELERIAEENVVFLTLSFDEKRERRELLRVRNGLSVSIREPSVEEFLVSLLKAEKLESICSEHCPPRFQPILKEYWNEIFLTLGFEGRQDRNEIARVFSKTHKEEFPLFVYQGEFPELKILKDVYNKIEPKELRNQLLGEWCEGLEYTARLKAWRSGKSKEQVVFPGLKILSEILKHSPKGVQDSFHESLALAMFQRMMRDLSPEVWERWIYDEERRSRLLRLLRDVNHEDFSYIQQGLGDLISSPEECISSYS